MRALTTYEGADEEPEFSPDGTRVLFTLSEPDWFGVARMDLASGEAVKRTLGQGVLESFFTATPGRRFLWPAERFAGRELDHRGATIARCPRHHTSRLLPFSIEQVFVGSSVTPTGADLKW